MRLAAKILAIAGDVVFILWMSFNAINESFKGTVYQKISYVGLMALLVLNITLIASMREE